jgi:hypothetical protein
MGMLVTICLWPMELAIVISFVVIDPGQPVLEEEERPDGEANCRDGATEASMEARSNS